MSARWNNNPVDISLGIKIFDAGAYRLKVKSLKPFLNQLKEGKTEQSGGVRFVFEVVAAPDSRDIGQTYIHNGYWHNEQSQSFTNSLIVPVYGFAANQEGKDAFNNDPVVKTKTWEVDPESNFLGDGWTYMIGREVGAELGEKLDNNGNRQQTAKYMPA